MTMNSMPFTYDNYDLSTNNVEPEWMRAERYDYCEGGLSSFVEKTHKETLIDRLAKIFARKPEDRKEIA